MVVVNAENARSYSTETTARDGLMYSNLLPEEVLASGSALWPSPDGKKVAFASFNDTFVNHTVYFKYGDPTADKPPQYPTPVDITYPKVRMGYRGEVGLTLPLDLTINIKPFLIKQHVPLKACKP